MNKYPTFDKNIMIFYQSILNFEKMSLFSDLKFLQLQLVTRFLRDFKNSFSNVFLSDMKILLENATTAFENIYLELCEVVTRILLGVYEVVKDRQYFRNRIVSRSLMNDVAMSKGFLMVVYFCHECKIEKYHQLGESYEKLVLLEEKIKTDIKMDMPRVPLMWGQLMNEVVNEKYKLTFPIIRKRKIKDERQDDGRYVKRNNQKQSNNTNVL